MTPFENELDQLLTKAEELLQDQKPVEALAVLERAQTLEPQYAWTILFRGVALGQLGRTEEAVPQLISAADSQSDDIDIQVDAARHLSVLEYYQDALVCANRAIGIDPYDAGAHAVHAEVLERLGRIEEAVPSRESAIVLDPEDTDSRYYLAVNYCDVGRYQEAFATAQPLFTQFLDDPDILRLHGACLSYLEHHEEALSKWAELERLEGVNTNLLHNRASTLDALGRSDEALATISEAIEDEPEIALNYYTRGMIHEHAGDNDHAIDDYLLALTLDPNHLDAAINLVELTTQENSSRQVMERVQLLREHEPSSAQLLYVLGRLAMDQGDQVQAKQTLESAIQREPALGICWYALAMLYSITGEPDAALAATDRALREFSDDVALWLARGQALQDLGRIGIDGLLRSRHGDVAGGRYALVLPGPPALARTRPSAPRARRVKRGVALDPENDAAMWMLALCYLRTGRCNDGFRLIQRLLTGDPSHLWGHLLRAAWHVQRHELRAALQDLPMPPPGV